MFCPKCGRPIENDAVMCVHCGKEIPEWMLEGEKRNNYNANQYYESKTGMGVLLEIFLGLIGLIIGICIYPSRTEARDTFVKGWLTAFLIEIGVAIILGVILGLTLPSYPYHY